MHHPDIPGPLRYTATELLALLPFTDPSPPGGLGFVEAGLGRHPHPRGLPHRIIAYRLPLPTGTTLYLHLFRLFRRRYDTGNPAG